MLNAAAIKSNKVSRFEGNLSLAILFAVYLLVSFLIYFKASNALLIDDGIAGLVKFENLGYRGFLTSFGFTSLYYFHDLFNLAVYYFVGKSSFGWFLVMLILHALNSTFAFHVFRHFYSILDIKRPAAIAIIGASLFLLSPYQTENVVWAATLHYSISLFIFLISSNLLLGNLEAGIIRKKTVLLVSGLFLLSLMTLEISLIFPFAYCCFGMAIIWNKKSSISFSELAIRFLLPLLLVIALYFISTRLIKGHWIPHYGAAHLQNNTLANYSTNTAKYFVKLFAFIHFADFNTRELVYTYCEKWKCVLAIELGLILFLLLILFRKRETAKTFICLLLLSLVLLLPSLHMYFMYLFPTENDRLSYFFSLGAYQLIPFLLLSLSVPAGILISFVFGLAGVFFLNKQVDKWHQAALLHTACIESFKWTDAPKVYVLNLPTNYNGVYEFRNNERLSYALDFFKKFKARDRIIPVLSSNYTSLNDSTVVSVINDSTLHVTILNNGGWLMNEFLGASDYANDEVIVDVEEGTSSYKVTFRKKIPGSVFIYSTGSGLKALSGFGFN